MPACPHCQGLTKPLFTLNSISYLEFFQCEECAKLSERQKGASGNPLPLVVTSPPAQARIIAP